MIGRKAAGFIETRGYLAAVEAADVCVKSANVQLVGSQTIGGGLWTVTITGDVGAVRAAITAAVASVQHVGEIISSHVIPRPAEGLGSLVNDFSLPASKPKPLSSGHEHNHDDDSHLNNDLGENEVELPLQADELKAEKSKKENEPKAEPNLSQENAGKPVISEEKDIAKNDALDSDSQVELLTEEQLYACRTVDLRRMARGIKNIGITGKKIKFARKNELVKAILASRQSNN